MLRTFMSFIPWIIDNRFTKLRQQNSQNCSFDICVIISHDVSVHTFYNYSTKKCFHFSHLNLLHQIGCVQKWLSWFYTILLCFSDDDPLRIETCRNINCDIITRIYKYLWEQFCAPCWYGAVEDAKGSIHKSRDLGWHCETTRTVGKRHEI